VELTTPAKSTPKEKYDPSNPTPDFEKYDPKKVNVKPSKPAETPVDDSADDKPADKPDKKKKSKKAPAKDKPKKPADDDE